MNGEGKDEVWQSEKKEREHKRAPGHFWSSLRTGRQEGVTAVKKKKIEGIAKQRKCTRGIENKSTAKVCVCSEDEERKPRNNK